MRKIVWPKHHFELDKDKAYRKYGRRHFYVNKNISSPSFALGIDFEAKSKKNLRRTNKY